MNIKAIVYLPIMIMVMLFGLVPFRNMHAMSMNMNHDMSGVNKSLASCCTSSSPSAILYQQQTPDRDENEDPEPPQRIPYYAQTQRLDIQDDPPKLNMFGASLLRPPDLVVLYNNFRI